MATIFRISILGLAHTVHSSRDQNGIRIERLVMTQCSGENSVFYAQFRTRNLQNLETNLVIELKLIFSKLQSSIHDRYRTIL